MKESQQYVYAAAYFGLDGQPKCRVMGRKNMTPNNYYLYSDELPLSHLLGDEYTDKRARAYENPHICEFIQIIHALWVKDEEIEIVPEKTYTIPHSGLKTDLPTATFFTNLCAEEKKRYKFIDELVEMNLVWH